MLQTFIFISLKLKNNYHICLSKNSHEIHFEQMQNKEIAAAFKLIAQLMELHAENPFKIKSYANAAFKIERLEESLKDLSLDEINSIEGIGKSIGAKIGELLLSGSFKDLEMLFEKTPSGVIEMLSIKGVGPKKIGVLWKELQVETMGELLYACHENRLVELSGFGTKTQDSIKKSIEFKIANKGRFHFSGAEIIAKKILDELKKRYKDLPIALTGSIRRKCEIIESVDILVGEESLTISLPENELGIKVNFHFCKPEAFYTRLFETTASEKHLEVLKQLGFNGDKNYASEQDIYHTLGLQYIEPELREGLNEIEKAKTGSLPDLIKLSDLKGIIHVHTTYSDGMHTLKQMAERCRDLGYQYLGITDHSQSAFYANGLKHDRIVAQHQEIDALNKAMAPFKIFKGIESDILNDGSLDYPDEVLQSFDFVIASIHSNLKMDEQKATQRLIRAIENPYTTILGHLTGRLLLSREGYPVDHSAVIDACAKHQVIIELNAHPYRLDIDWRWINYALEKGVKISINPDSHKMEGYADMQYGVNVARKAGLTADMTFNAQSLIAIEEYFDLRKKGF